MNTTRAEKAMNIDVCMRMSDEDAMAWAMTDCANIVAHNIAQELVDAVMEEIREKLLEIVKEHLSRDGHVARSTFLLTLQHTTWQRIEMEKAVDAMIHGMPQHHPDMTLKKAINAMLGVPANVNPNRDNSSSSREAILASINRDPDGLQDAGGDRYVDPHSEEAGADHHRREGNP